MHNGTGSERGTEKGRGMVWHGMQADIAVDADAAVR